MASTIKVDTIDTPSGAGNITISRPIVADISSVTGTLPSAVFPATLPVLNGSNLTGITHTPADNSVTGAKLNISLLAGDTMYASATDTLAKLAKGTAGQTLTMNAGATAPEWADAGGGFTLKGAPVATTSGTNIDVSGFPAGISILVVGFMGVSFAARAVLNLHMGTASGIVDGANSYLAGSAALRDSTYPDSIDTSYGLPVNEHYNSASGNLNGQMIITRMSTSNEWTASWSMYNKDYEEIVGAGYIPDLGGEFTQLRLRGGGNTFDAGSVNFSYI